jgi:hypothetical protein
MCGTCVAERALWAGRCKDDKCKAFLEGEQIRWSDAPAPVANPKWHRPSALEKVALKARKRWRKRWSAVARKKIAARMLNRIPPEWSAVAVCVRTTGKGAEFKSARYQLRLSAQRKWPQRWSGTKDLAGSMGLYGLDVRWDAVPKPVQDWVRGVRANAPSEPELRKWHEKKRGHKKNGHAELAETEVVFRGQKFKTLKRVRHR